MVKSGKVRQCLLRAGFWYSLPDEIAAEVLDAGMGALEEPQEPTVSEAELRKQENQTRRIKQLRVVSSKLVDSEGRSFDNYLRREAVLLTERERRGDACVVKLRNQDRRARLSDDSKPLSSEV